MLRLELKVTLHFITNISTEIKLSISYIYRAENTHMAIQTQYIETFKNFLSLSVATACIQGIQ